MLTLMTEDVQWPRSKRKTPHIVESKTPTDARGGHTASGYCSICGNSSIWFSYLSPNFDPPTSDKEECSSSAAVIVHGYGGCKEEQLGLA